jgi:exopolysaccharide production protein ExoZ
MASASVENTSSTKVRIVLSVQYLRALAVIAVVIYHQLSSISPVFLIGMHGVDVFFVVSGFVMVIVTEDGKATPTGFTLNRLVRIVPAYWLATTMAFILAVENTRVLYHPIPDTVTFIRSLLFIPTLNAYGDIQPTLYLGWTLQYEMFFYALFAALLSVRTWRVTILSAVLIGLVCLGAAFQPTGAIGRTYTDPIFLEFLAGAWVGKLFGADLARYSPSTQIVGSGVIAAFLFMAAPIAPTLVFGGWAVLIVALGLLLECRNRLPLISWLKSVGDASFAIYLFQEFAYLTVLSLGLLPFLPVHPYDAPVLTRTTCVIAAVGLGVAMWWYFERPTTTALRTMLKN